MRLMVLRPSSWPRLRSAPRILVKPQLGFSGANPTRSWRWHARDQLRSGSHPVGIASRGRHQELADAQEAPRGPTYCARRRGAAGSAAARGWSERRAATPRPRGAVSSCTAFPSALDPSVPYFFQPDYEVAVSDQKCEQ
jgi:hypothetical protein